MTCKKVAFQKAGIHKKWLNWIEDRKKNNSLNTAVDGDPDNFVWVKDYKQESRIPPYWDFLMSLRANKVAQLIKIYFFIQYFSFELYSFSDSFYLVSFLKITRKYKQTFFSYNQIFQWIHSRHVYKEDAPLVILTHNR